MDLLAWDSQGMTTAEMQTRLAGEGKAVSIELVRLRLREARQETQGRPVQAAAAADASEGHRFGQPP